MENNNKIDFQSTISIIDILKIFKVRFKLIAFLFVISISISFVYYIFKKPVYKTEMIVTSSIVTSERLAILMDPIEELVMEKNYTELSQLMNIDSLTASHIKSIAAKEIKDDARPNAVQNFDGEVLRQQNCLVVLKIKANPKLADTVQSGILNYLRKNKFINRKSKIERDNLEFMKKRIQQEIKALDTLKKKITLSGDFNMMDPSAINNTVADLYQKELHIDSKMQLEDGGVNIIRDVSRFKSPIEPKLWLCVLLGLIFGFFLSIITISLLEITQNLKSIDIKN